jgi:hypothetical protein
MTKREERAGVPGAAAIVPHGRATANMKATSLVRFTENLGL